jgi:hypothetical protein
MTSHPPMFASQMAEQKLWDEGFKAGISEAVNELKNSINEEETGVPSTEWVESLAQKIIRKYQ